MAQVLVTGGNGFIGRHLCAALLDRGDSVTILGRRGIDRAAVEIRGRTIPILPLDLCDRSAMDALFAATPFDQVYHLAARTRRPPLADLQDLTESAEEDLVGLLVLLGAAASAARPPQSFVRSGTIAEYGGTAVPAGEESCPRPIGSYGAALAAGTIYLEMSRPRRPFPAATARLALVYGPGQSTDFLMARLLHDMPKGLPVHISHPRDRRDMIHIDDAVDALLRLGEGVEGVVNIGTGRAPSMAEIAEAVLRATGADPGLVSYGDPTDSSGISELSCDPSKARDLIGWTAANTLEVGIRKTLEALSPQPEPEMLP